MKSLMYTKFANQYADAVVDNCYNALFERPSMLAMLGELKNKKVLDLACGSGVYSELFVAQGAEVTAIDISHEMVEIVAQKLADKVRCYQQDLTHGLPQETDEYFDVIVFPLGIHYIELLEPLLKEIKRVLKPNGYFVFSTHHPLVDLPSPSGNYFARELITEQWNTVGHPVTVQFYRRSLTELFTAIFESGLCVTNFNEGVLLPEMKQRFPEQYQHLSKHPNFIFIQCQHR